MKKIIYIILALFLVNFYACQEEVEVDPGQTAVVEMSGQWWLRLYDTDGNELDSWLETYTYNTASNISDSIWIEVHDYDMRFKVSCDVISKTFSAAGTMDILNGDVVDVANGIILEDATTTMGGHVVDSIYFDYSDASGDYVFAGQRFTGFAEDDPFTPEQ
jgi:hypothetical protein